MLNEEQKKIVEREYVENDLVRTFIRKYKLNYNDYHGVVSESLIKAVLAYDESRGKLSSLFYKIARNDVYNERTRKKVDLLGISDTIEMQNEQSVEDFSMEFFLDGLSEPEKEIVRYLNDGCSYSEIARLTGVSNSTMTRRMEVIRKKIRD